MDDRLLSGTGVIDLADIPCVVGFNPIGLHPSVVGI